jgi:hypothetical protein
VHSSTAVKEENSHARIAKGGPTTTPSNPPAALYLNQLWTALTDEDRRRTLTTLSQLVAKQLQPPPGAKEVEHEDR